MVGSFLQHITLKKEDIVVKMVVVIALILKKLSNNFQFIYKRFTCAMVFLGLILFFFEK